ncbi:secretoglobin family 2B member 2-like [Mastomys coucha]|uniref:secretoglobin family 2B member 2-like n=1 Tax=Mastomys coucha TaxID=35658 RepID=UPI0012621B26|nr:secretoglobin family 2B member 2-like [Mastomys coucha]
MKGTLLLLALLVTGELGFQTTEACIPFFGVYLSVVSGSREWLHHELKELDSTVEEKVAFEKIQDCYEEAGTKAKSQDVQFMASMLFSSECKTYYTKEVISEITTIFTESQLLY